MHAGSGLYLNTGKDESGANILELKKIETSKDTWVFVEKDLVNDMPNGRKGFLETSSGRRIHITQKDLDNYNLAKDTGGDDDDEP